MNMNRTEDKYVNMNYARTEGKTFDMLKVELKDVYNSHPEFVDFNAMVDLFACDDFYNLHYVAKQYKEMI